MFANTRFWIAQRVPLRSSFKAIVQRHEGIVTPLEIHADILISDHMRPRDAPPGSLSYKFIEECVKQNRLLEGEERDAHLCGPRPGSVREVGDVTRPTKTHQKVAYTTEDDDVIREWVKNAVRKGDRLAGNEIWKDLETQNSRHTWQSWRDRWLKKLAHQMPPGWELEARGLEVDVEELVSEVLEEEARSEELKREEEASQVGGEDEALQRVREIMQEEQEKGNVVESVEQSQSDIDDAESVYEESEEEIARRRQEELTRIPEDYKYPIPLLSSSPPSQTVLGRVAQSKLNARKSTVPCSTSVVTMPYLTSTIQAQPEAWPTYSPRALSELQREPSVGYTPQQLKRQKHHHQLAVAQEEMETATPLVVTPTNEVSAPICESEPLPRPFTAEDFLRIYDTIDDIMATDEDGLLAGLDAFADPTIFTRQQWHDFLREDVLSVQMQLKNVRQKSKAVVACLTDYIERIPNQPWRRWKLHYEGRGCRVLKDNMSPDLPDESQKSQSDDNKPHDELRPQTPSRKRPWDDLEESPQYKSPRVAETANISRQRVDINSQSTASGTSQPESTRAHDDEFKVQSTFPRTQAILAAETQPLNFSIPDPDGNGSTTESIESDDFERERRASLRDQELINQQLSFNTDDTEVPAAMDFDLPEPEDGFEATDEPAEGIETQLLKDTQALGEDHIGEVEEEEEEEEAEAEEIETASQVSLDFDAFANELMEEGHSPEDIITAIHTTSANIPMVHTVLQSLKLGIGVPTIMRGIWTAQDDEDILGGDARKLERVEAKHGWRGEGGCKARQYFLRDSMAAAELVEKQSR
jgi:hypothetical protein